MSCATIFRSICLCFLLNHVFCQPEPQRFTNGSEGGALRNLLLVDSNVLVGSQSFLYQLDSRDLTLKNSLNVTTANRLLLLLNDSGPGVDDVLSCQQTSCILVSSGSLAQKMVDNVADAENPLVPGIMDSLTAIALENERSFFVAREVLNTIDTDIPSIVSKISYTINGDMLDLSQIGKQIEASLFHERKFLTIFKTDNFTYLVFELDAPNPNRLRFVRLCNDDPGVNNDVDLTTYTEVKLECAGISSDSITITSASSIVIDNHQMVLVAMTSTTDDSTSNHICIFNVTEIDEVMDDRLDQCIAMENNVNINDLDRTTTDSGDPCGSSNLPVSPCSRPGSFRFPLGVPDPVMGTTILSPSSSDSFNALISFSYESITYVLAGVGSNVDEYYYSGNTLVFIRSINVTTDPPVEELHWSPELELFFALSSSTVANYPINVCSQYTTCSTCVDSKDPLCGWCTLSSMCTKLSDCTTTPQVWGTSDADCPVIESVDPMFLYTHELTSNSDTNFTIEVLNVPNVTYDCVYMFEEQEAFSTMPADIVSNTTIVCLPPSDNDLPPFGDNHTLSAMLSLRKASSVDVVSWDNVQFTNCSTQISCFDCLSSASRCQWCPISLQCTSKLLNCSLSIDETAINGSDPFDHCPFLQQPENTVNYLIHNELDTKLELRANNLQNFQPVCRIIGDSGNINYTLPLIVQSDTHVTCDGSASVFNVSLSRSRPTVEAELFVLVNNVPIRNLNNTRVIFYSCQLQGENCGQCLSIDKQFNCVYCMDTTQCITSSGCSSTALQGQNDFIRCETPTITSFSPLAGPLQGNTTIVIIGTNLGADSSQILDITIGEVKCNPIISAYVPGIRVSCVTQVSIASAFQDRIVIHFPEESTTSSRQMYSFKVPQLARPPVTPSLGPRAGGTEVTVMGVDIGIGSNRFVSLAGRPCIITKFENDNFTCVSTFSERTTVRNQGIVSIRIDGYTATELGFDYDNNPTFDSISPLFSFQSGGTIYIVRGRDLDTVEYPRLLFYKQGRTTSSNNGTVKRATLADDQFDFDNPIRSEACFEIVDSEMKCYAPRLNGSTDSKVAIGLEMDNVTSLLELDINITVHSDPVFDSDLTFRIEPGQTRNLTITGMEFQFSLDQIQIFLKDVNINCVPKRILSSRSEVICEMEVSSRTIEDEYDIQVQIGGYVKTVGTVTIRTNADLFIPILSICLAAFVLSIIVMFIVFFSIFYRKYKQKDQQNDFLLFELDRLESSMAHECKLGFAELQTDVNELTGDLSGSRLPFHDFHMYLLQSLFPGAKDHPVLHELQLQPQRKAQTERALKDFHQIILNKNALLTIVQSLESERAFTIRDKSSMGSLLMLALHDRLDYATEILKALLSSLVKKTVAESYAKLLLRRTESVAEKMLSSWLVFTLHGYVMEHTGQPLYRLFKAVKAQLEKGPVDVVTGEARYSLSEQKLIRQQINVTFINATVESDDGSSVSVKLLDCDSISQAKEKMLDAVYKNSPVSQRPALTAIDIEYCRVPKEEGYILRDEDGSNNTESGWRKINTLAHYWIPERAVFKLVPRRERPPTGRVYDYTGSLMVTHGYRNRSASDAEDGWRVWHLFKQHEEDPRSSPFISKKMVTEIYLPRMLSTKTILQSFVDNLFQSIFTLSQPPLSPSQLYTPINATFTPLTTDGYAPGTDSLPVPIKYLFDFLDDEAASHKITDTDVLHTWKNNSLALRFWVNIIKNPEFVFDINKSAIVDSCLSVIAQAFIDGCSSSDAKPTINSPTSKLLFNKEVQGYKASVKEYYEQISELPRIPEETMDTYLLDLSAHQSQLLGKSGHFHTESALNEIMRYCIKYKESIIEGLRSSGLESEAVMMDSAIQRCM